MNNRDELLALAARVEAATGPDREIDYAIFCATAIKERANYWHPTEENHFTASIDAAMSLVPEGCLWNLSYLGGRCRSDVYPPGFDWNQPPAWASAVTPALALTAAALRALAQQENSDAD